MRVEKIKVYTFEELTEEVKNKVIEDWRNSETDYFIGPNYDDFYLDDLKENGFILDANDFRYSLNNCQGDGVSFLCSEFNDDLLFKNFLKEYKYDREYNILKTYDIDYSMGIYKQNYHYVHEKSVYFECILENNYILDNYPLIYTKLENILSDFTDFIESLRIDLCLKYEKMLYDEIDYINSNEYIIETISINEYEFLEDGTKY